MFTLNCKGKLLSIAQPIVMGIVNTTPDSFYTNSQQQSIESAFLTAEKMLQDGAAIVDIGAQTTQPGSSEVGIEEELKRAIPVIEKIHTTFPEAIISIDTYHATVAKKAVEAGASIVNDVSGGLMDNQMLPTVAALHVPFVCMHMKGTPKNMQQNPTYNNVTEEVLTFFIEKIDACKKAGINDVIIDPGFGFGKTIEHNYTLLKQLAAFKILQKPILLGVSRKSMIYKPLEVTANEALNGTSVLHTIGLENGASILRVHDVKEAIECIHLTQLYNQTKI
ncbi:MAG TPA: dihydropteroate synthase [Chitinophagaceae bacterium]|jgi:dihydropteroate synthase|nr:dihydropteroate synthase [Chitinophagaceae bacterium]